MKILVTNDDGIYSEGIYSLYSSLKSIGEVYVVAPITEQSAVGHAITINNPLKISEVYRKDKYFGIGVDGTPADCVKLAFSDIIKDKIDLVVSGINHGANLCNNIIYSGTVSAATEGSMLGVKSIAMSLASIEYTDFSIAASFAAYFAEYIYNMDIDNSVTFNVNVPPLKKDEIKGWKWTIQGKTKYLDTFEKRYDPKGNVYYWMVGEQNIIVSDPNADDTAVREGFISVTPLHYDMCDYKVYEQLREKEVGHFNF
ncbi:MAG: 5'/3'-nucleotidase SurE [Deferribacterota bacterium]|nr:5'/3'-nucleotidase SurE [Deferribacterota bacterium]